MYRDERRKSLDHAGTVNLRNLICYSVTPHYRHPYIGQSRLFWRKVLIFSLKLTRLIRTTDTLLCPKLSYIPNPALRMLGICALRSSFVVCLLLLLYNLLYTVQIMKDFYGLIPFPPPPSKKNSSERAWRVWFWSVRLSSGVWLLCCSSLITFSASCYTGLDSSVFFAFCIFIYILKKMNLWSFLRFIRTPG